MFLVCSRQARWAALLSLAAGTFSVGAQSIEPHNGQATRAGTRAELLERVRLADSLGRKEEAFVLRARLADGDFEVGDRIIVNVDGEAHRSTDTLTVLVGKVIRLGEPVGDLGLVGVLRSEVGDSVTRRYARMYRNLVVNVTPLVRVQISGSVRTPGFYYARLDMPLSDVIMRNGGQDQNADIGNVIVRRGERTLWAKEDVQSAFTDGLTIDRLGLESGDEIVVGMRRGPSKWMLALQIGVPVLTAIIIQSVIRR